MKSNWKILGLVVLAAGILYYPALKLYQYITRQKAEGPDEDEDVMRTRIYRPAYRGVHALPKPHHNGDGKKG